MTVNRFCSSGLQTIALAAQRDHDRRSATSSSPAGSNPSAWCRTAATPPSARRVADGAQAGGLHGDDRDRRDRRGALQDLARGAGRIRAREPAPHGRAQQAGAFNAEIVPMATKKKRRRQGDRGEHVEDVTLAKRRGQPARHDAGGARRAQAGARGQGTRFITAGNASQLSDGASALRA